MKTISSIIPKTCKTWDDVFIRLSALTQNLNRLQHTGILKVTTHLNKKKYLIPDSFEITVNDIGNSNGIIHFVYNIFGDDKNTMRYTINASSPSGMIVSGLIIDIPKYGVRYSYLDNV